MIRTLLIIAGAALVLSVASLSGAFALGGVDLKRHGWTWTIDDDGEGHSMVRRGGPAEDPGPETTKTLAFNGGDALTLELPADVTYVQGAANTVVITGPQKMVERVQVDGGRIRMEDGPERVTLRWTGHSLEGWSDAERLKITVTAPSVVRFAVEGSSDVTIRDYDQPTMALDISGSGEVEAFGKVQALEVDISGSGEADLRALQTTDANVAISGSGDATVAPTGKAELSISGSGDIEVTTRPASVTQDVSGSGDIDIG